MEQQQVIAAVELIDWAPIEQDIPHGNCIRSGALAQVLEDYENTVERANDEIDSREDRISCLGDDISESGDVPEYVQQMSQLVLEIQAIAGMLSAYEQTFSKLVEQIREVKAACVDWDYDSPDIISESYFVEHVTDMISDCYELPAQMNSGEWPYRHISIDYEAAADELAAHDFTLLTLDGQSYFVR